MDENQMLLGDINSSNDPTYTVYINGVTFNTEKNSCDVGTFSGVRNYLYTFTKFFGSSYFVNKGEIENLEKLNQISKLKDGWDGDCAVAFEESLIEKVRDIITNLNYLPEIFPTACDSIQLEFDREDGAYLEIEVSADEKAEVFTIDNRGKENTTEIKSFPDEINKVVDCFYG